MNNIERLKASLRALTQQHIDLHDMWTYGASERATASELINNNHQQQTPQTPQQEVYRVSERSERTHNNNTNTMNKQQLLTELQDAHQQYDDLFDMWTHGPRDERVSWVRPEPAHVAEAEQAINGILAKLVKVGYSPCERPTILELHTYENMNDDSAPF